MAISHIVISPFVEDLAICIVPMIKRLHLARSFNFGAFAHAQLIEQLPDQLIRLGKNGMSTAGSALMIHAPAVSPVVIHCAMNNRFRRRFLRLRLAQAQTQYTGEIEPV